MKLQKCFSDCETSPDGDDDWIYFLGELFLSWANSLLWSRWTLCVYQTVGCIFLMLQMPITVSGCRTRVSYSRRRKKPQSQGVCETSASDHLICIWISLSSVVFSAYWKKKTYKSKWWKFSTRLPPFTSILTKRCPSFAHKTPHTAHRGAISDLRVLYGADGLLLHSGGGGGGERKKKNHGGPKKKLTYDQ